MPKSLRQRLLAWAQNVKRDVHALYLASRHPRMPWYAKLLALLVIGYALSPIDLIPDFVPVLGYVDDLVLLPLGILLVIRLIPADLMAECRAAADQAGHLPQNWKAAVIIVALWVLAIAIAAQWLFGIVHQRKL